MADGRNFNPSGSRCYFCGAAGVELTRYRRYLACVDARACTERARRLLAARLSDDGPAAA